MKKNPFIYIEHISACISRIKEDLMKFEEKDRQARDLAVQFYTKII